MSGFFDSSSSPGATGRRRRRGLSRLLFALVPLIAALPLVVMAVPESLRLPQAPDQDEPGALFDHWTHSDYGCYACHPGIFPQQRLTFTHDDMDKGMYCAACHTGDVAFSIEDADCETCHVE